MSFPPHNAASGREAAPGGPPAFLSPPGAGAGLLVIGYGNTLRRDDGAGVRVAEAIQALNLPGVRVITCHQLAPELAVPLAAAARVVFVDASAPGAARAGLAGVAGRDSPPLLAHAADPGSLLGLAETLFGRRPRAWLLAVPARDFALGEQLSARARRGVAAAVRQIRQLAVRPGPVGTAKFCEGLDNPGQDAPAARR